MDSIRNEGLGNFGFLLEFDQGFLFELAQLAESNFYTNKRLCSVFIRQLTESFFDFVISDHIPQEDHEQLNLKDDIAASGILDKQKALCWYFKKERAEYSYFSCPKFLMAFPAYPGSISSGSRLANPFEKGSDLNPYTKEDPEGNTLYVWDYIRRLGNAGSHAVLSDLNRTWLQESNIYTALEQLCYRMKMYFYGTRNQSLPTYPDKLKSLPIASRETFYPYGKNEIHQSGRSGLPEYTEQIYYTVMPTKKANKWTHSDPWQNYINKYAIVRRYHVDDSIDVRNYLLQSQKAYLLLQQNEILDGIASYVVLADLRSSADYYVTAYEFGSMPYDLSEKVMEDLCISQDINQIFKLQLALVRAVANLEKCHIYHRMLTHNSLKILKTESGRCVLRIIDFELVKLFNEENEYDSTTVYRQANQYNKLIHDPSNYKQDQNNIQYGYHTFNENMSEEEYAAAQRKTVGEIMLNMMCPRHLGVTHQYSKCADPNEIFSSSNSVFSYCKEQGTVQLLNNLVSLAENLIQEKSETLYHTIQEMEKLDVTRK